MQRDAARTIDEALIKMRRIWAPITTGRPSATRPPVDLSTVLVVDALTRMPTAPSVKDIAEHLGVAQTTTSRLVARAVGGGFVAKQVAPGDVRRTELFLTPAGERLSALSLAFRFSYLDQVTRQWPSEDVEVFATLLHRFAMEVVAHPPDPTRSPHGFDPSVSPFTGDG